MAPSNRGSKKPPNKKSPKKKEPKPTASKKKATKQADEPQADEPQAEEPLAEICCRECWFEKFRELPGTSAAADAAGAATEQHSTGCPKCLTNIEPDEGKTSTSSPPIVPARIVTVVTEHSEPLRPVQEDHYKAIIERVISQRRAMRAGPSISSVIQATSNSSVSQATSNSSMSQIASTDSLVDSMGSTTGTDSSTPLDSNYSLDMNEDGQRLPKRRRLEGRHVCQGKECKKCLEAKKNQDLLVALFEPEKRNRLWKDSDEESN